MLQAQGSVKFLAAIGSTIGLLAAVTAPIAAADDRTRVPMPGVFKRCDFSANTYVPAAGNGRALALISSGQQQVVAEVELLTAKPNMHYTARLIQTPRQSLACSAGDPGVTAASLNTDAFGAASVVLRAPILSGTTGAWVFIDRPAEYSQTPAESYTSYFIAKV